LLIAFCNCISQHCHQQPVLFLLVARATPGGWWLRLSGNITTIYPAPLDAPPTCSQHR